MLPTPWLEGEEVLELGDEKESNDLTVSAESKYRHTQIMLLERIHLAKGLRVVEAITVSVTTNCSRSSVIEQRAYDESGITEPKVTAHCLTRWNKALVTASTYLCVMICVMLHQPIRNKDVVVNATRSTAQVQISSSRIHVASTSTWSSVYLPIFHWSTTRRRSVLSDIELQLSKTR